MLYDICCCSCRPALLAPLRSVQFSSVQALESMRLRGVRQRTWKDGRSQDFLEADVCSCQCHGASTDRDEHGTTKCQERPALYPQQRNRHAGGINVTNKTTNNPGGSTQHLAASYGCANKVCHPPLSYGYANKACHPVLSYGCANSVRHPFQKNCQQHHPHTSLRRLSPPYTAGCV